MRATRSGSRPVPAEFRFGRSEYQALNPVGRITCCIRLPGGPASCGVPQEDAALRSVKVKRSFSFLSFRS